MVRKRASLGQYLVAVSTSWAKRMTGPLSLILQILVGLFAIGLVTVLGVAATLAREIETRVTFVGLAFVALLVALYNVWAKERNDCRELEEKLEPKLSVGDPQEIVEPKGATGISANSREYRLKIQNDSASVVSGCYVKMKSLVNVNGHQSDVLNINFKRNIDQPIHIQGFDHPQSFDLMPHSDEIVSICGTNKNVDPSGNTVVMLYAIHGAGGAGIRNAIPRQFFPHTLELEIGAQNVAAPTRRRYELAFDSQGIFRMTLLGQ